MASDRRDGALAHETDAAAALRNDWTEALAAEGLGGPEVAKVVERLVTHLQRSVGGTELYIPVLGREYPIAAIRAAFRRGDSVRSICREHQIDRRTLYRLLGDELG